MEKDEPTLLEGKVIIRDTFISFLQGLDLSNPDINAKDMEGRFLILADLMGFNPTGMDAIVEKNIISIIMYKAVTNESDFIADIKKANNNIKSKIDDNNNKPKKELINSLINTINNDEIKKQKIEDILNES